MHDLSKVEAVILEMAAELDSQRISTGQFVLSRFSRVARHVLRLGNAHSELRIRRARRDEAFIVSDLVQRAYAPYVSRIGCRPAPMDDHYGEKIAQGSVFVAKGAGCVVGLIVLIPNANHLLVENVAVDPEKQSQGIGHSLLAFAETSARDAGVSTLRLYTNAAMTENILFYLRLGFEETDRRINEGFERVFFSKRVVSG